MKKHAFDSREADSREARQNPASRVGRAYQCEDGVIRWITGVTLTKRVKTCWRKASGDPQIWYAGATMSLEDFLSFHPSREVPAPSSGETYIYCGYTGLREKRTAP